MRWILVLAWVMITPAWAFAAPSCVGRLDALAVTEWSISPVDARTNKLDVTISNNLPKPIRMVDGSVGFVDALGKEIARYSIDRDAAIDTGGSFTETGNWGQFTFERLLKLSHSEVEAFACIRAVMYDDGTKEEF